MKKSKYLLMLSVSIAIALLGSTSGMAQSNPLHLVDQGNMSSHIRWARSGQYLNYFLVTYDEQDLGWRQYDMQIQQITKPSTSPIYRNLPDVAKSFIDQLDLTPPSSESETVNYKNAAYAAPSEQFVIYPYQKRYTVWDMALANLQTEQSITLDAFIWVPNTSRDVLWNDASTAALIFSRPDPAYAYTAFYLYNFSGNFDNVIARKLEWVGFNIPPPSRIYWIYEPLEFVANSNVFLAIVRDGNVTTTPLPRYLMLWNVEQPLESVLLPNLDAATILDATFAPNDPTKILFVDANGLSEYDLTTNTVSLIDGRINKAWVRRELSIPDNRDVSYEWHRALFSPDGKWVALYLSGLGYDSESKLYVLPTGR